MVSLHHIFDRSRQSNDLHCLNNDRISRDSDPKDHYKAIFKPPVKMYAFVLYLFFSISECCHSLIDFIAQIDK
jgi:hypothetical protein